MLQKWQTFPNLPDDPVWNLKFSSSTPDGSSSLLDKLYLTVVWFLPLKPTKTIKHWSSGSQISVSLWISSPSRIPLIKKKTHTNRVNIFQVLWRNLMKMKIHFKFIKCLIGMAGSEFLFSNFAKLVQHGITTRSNQQRLQNPCQIELANLTIHSDS